MKNTITDKKRIKVPPLSSHSFGLKISLICLILLCFQLPMGMIRTTVQERQWRRIETQDEIINSRGGEVCLGGPVLVIPREWKETALDEEGRIAGVRMKREDIFLLPDSLNIEGHGSSEIKSRGIYSVPVYTLLLEGKGVFNPEETLSQYNPDEIQWDSIRVQISYPLLKGMKRIDPFLWNGTEQVFQPGGQGESIYPGVISVPVKLDKAQNTACTFLFRQEIQGGESISFLPLARETKISLDSDWASPSFNGYYLPHASTLSDTGFTAEWEINYLSRNIPQSWTSPDSATMEDIRQTAFGVRFFPVVTSYDKINRTLKYRLLFLMLPFLTFFLFEVIRKHRIHPVQYILSGAGNMMFYLLLLSLSEHISFNGAYFCASAAVTVMLTFYAVSVLQAHKAGLILFPVSALSYGFLYFVLQSEDYALLMGSAGLFFLISLVMILTRKIEWYGAEKTAPPQ